MDRVSVGGEISRVFLMFLSFPVFGNLAILRKGHMWHVYILKCNDGTYYTGCTSDMANRLNRHNAAQVKYTSSRLPIEVIVSISFRNKYKAYDFENYLKSGSGKAFMNKRFI